MKRAPARNERWAELKSPQELHLSTYEWAAAKKGMDEAKMLGLMSLRASEYVSQTMRHVGDSLAVLLRLH